MKKLLKILALGVALFVLYGVARYTGPVVFEREISPSGDTAAVLISLDEDSSLPYGTAIVIEPAWLPVPERWADSVFRGDCGGTDVLRWASDTKLVVTCSRFSRVERQLTKRGPFLIEYVESLPTP